MDYPGGTASAPASAVQSLFTPHARRPTALLAEPLSDAVFWVDALAASGLAESGAQRIRRARMSTAFSSTFSSAFSPPAGAVETVVADLSDPRGVALTPALPSLRMTPVDPVTLEALPADGGNSTRLPEGGSLLLAISAVHASDFAAASAGVTLEVMLSQAADDVSNATVTPNRIVLTAADAHTPHYVTVTSQDDSVQLGAPRYTVVLRRVIDDSVGL